MMPYLYLMDILFTNFLQLGYNTNEGAQFVFDLIGGQTVSSTQHARDVLERIVKV